MSVMADENDTALEFIDRLNKRFTAFDIQMIGGLIQYQDLRCGGTDQRKGQPCFLAT